MFNDDYYQKGQDEEEIPEVSDEELKGSPTIADRFQRSSFALSVENWDEMKETPSVDETKSKKKKKKKLSEVIAQAKPTFDPSEKEKERESSVFNRFF